MNKNNRKLKNIDRSTVDGFGDEWSRFQQSELTKEEQKKVFDDYFSIFPWEKLPNEAIGVDVGCGSGRWGMLIADKVSFLHLVDASEEALNVAKKNLSKFDNCEFHHASVDEMSFADESLDFAYSLGVLHHVPKTEEAINSVAKKLKQKGILLLYLYYRFDNRPFWFRSLWKLSDLMRNIISRMPHFLRYISSQIIAALVYWPLSRMALLIERIYKSIPNWPLFYYRNKSFYVMRTDALDRFGTRLEQRFTKKEIYQMLDDAGFDDIKFSDKAPFWCVSAIKK